MKVYGPDTKLGELVYFPAHGKAGVVTGWTASGLPRVEWLSADSSRAV